MRKLLFWLHLTAGVIAGLVILIMSVTGVLLTYERQILEYADRHNAQAIPQPGATRLPLDQLLLQVGGKATNITVRSNPREPVEVAITRDRSVYLNPYTGATVGESSQRTHAFFSSLRQWHRWLALAGPAREKSRAIFDAANLVFLFIVLSGPILWLPKRWSWKHVRPILWFRSQLSGKARDFNWHNAIGIWSFIPLVIVVGTGVIMSYQWANNLLYRMTGTEPPAPRAAREAAPRGERRNHTEDERPAAKPLDALFEQASQKIPGWKTITCSLGSSGPVSFAIDAGTGGQPQKRATLTLDRVTGATLNWESFESYNAGRKLRSYARSAHTGEVGGFIGQTIAGIATLGAVFLVYTGIVLSLRRFLAWRKRKQRAPEVVEVAAGSAI